MQEKSDDERKKAGYFSKMTDGMRKVFDDKESQYK